MIAIIITIIITFLMFNYMYVNYLELNFKQCHEFHSQYNLICAKLDFRFKRYKD